MRLDELKREVAELEALAEKGNAQDTEPTTEVSAVTIETDDDRIKRFFAEAMETADAQYEERLAADNATKKVCGECCRRQLITNVTCELCGAIPSWLPGAERSPASMHDALGNLADKDGKVVTRGGYSRAQDAWKLHNWKVWASTDASVEELKSLIERTSLPESQWKVSHAQRVLRHCGEEIPKSFWGEILDTRGKNDKQSTESKETQEKTIDYDAVKRFYDFKIEQLDQQIRDHTSNK